MARGGIKAGLSTIIGAAGEYFVMAELLRRGWLAGLTPRAAPDFDIVATKDGQAIHVRVKTKTADSKLFRWNIRKDGYVFRRPIRENDFCVLVDIGGPAPEYYVIPTKQVEEKLEQIYDAWRAAKPTRSATNPIRAFEHDPHGDARDDEWLSRFRDWTVLIHSDSNGHGCKMSRS